MIFKLSFGLGFNNLDNQTNIFCLHSTVYSTHYTVYHKNQSLVYQKQQERKPRRENWFKILPFIVYNMVLKISCGCSLCSDFANYVDQTNKLRIVHTFHCTLYTVHYVPYRPELHSLETSQERGHMWLMWRLCMIST